MKSPWNFLINFTRRSRRGDAREARPASDDELATNSRDEAPSSVEKDQVVAAPDLDSLRGPEDGGNEQEDDLGMIVAAVATAGEEKSRIPSPSTRKRAARRRVDRGGTAQPDTFELAPAQRGGPHDSARELDHEIRQLRLQLAQKLELQNAQLRKMLERFDR